MRIVFDSKDFTESLDIGFKGQHQLPFITVVKEYRDKHGNHLGASMLWSSSYPGRRVARFFRRLFPTSN